MPCLVTNGGDWKLAGQFLTLRSYPKTSLTIVPVWVVDLKENSAEVLRPCGFSLDLSVPGCKMDEGRSRNLI